MKGKSESEVGQSPNLTSANSQKALHPSPDLSPHFDLGVVQGQLLAVYSVLRASSASKHLTEKEV